MIYAVIDTNIIVSSFLTKNEMAATRRVINSVLDGLITPMYNDEILTEYSEVLRRPKFHLNANDIDILINYFRCYGINSSRTTFNGDLPDEEDRVFYEVALNNKDSFLVTGNLKHFPKNTFVISPAEMVALLEKLCPD